MREAAGPFYPRKRGAAGVPTSLLQALGWGWEWGAEFLDQGRGEKARREWWARMVGEGQGPHSVDAAGVLLLGPRRRCPHFAFCRERASAPLSRFWTYFTCALSVFWWELGRKRKTRLSQAQVGQTHISTEAVTALFLSCGHLERVVIPPAGGRSRAGEMVSWYRSCSLSGTFLRLEVTLHRDESHPVPLPVLAELVGRTLQCFCAPPSSSWLPPSWNTLGLSAGCCRVAGREGTC